MTNIIECLRGGGGPPRGPPTPRAVLWPVEPDSKVSFQPLVPLSWGLSPGVITPFGGRAPRSGLAAKNEVQPLSPLPGPGRRGAREPRPFISSWEAWLEGVSGDAPGPTRPPAGPRPRPCPASRPGEGPESPAVRSAPRGRVGPDQVTTKARGQGLQPSCSSRGGDAVLSNPGEAADLVQSGSRVGPVERPAAPSPRAAAASGVT